MTVDAPAYLLQHARDQSLQNRTTLHLRPALAYPSLMPSYDSSRYLISTSNSSRVDAPPRMTHNLLDLSLFLEVMEGFPRQ